MLRGQLPVPGKDGGLVLFGDLEALGRCWWRCGWQTPSTQLSLLPTTNDISYWPTNRHLDRVAHPWFEQQVTSLKKWELRGLAEEQTEAREPGEDRFVADPDKITLPIFVAEDLWEFWSRKTSRPLPMPDTTVLIFSSLGPFESPCMACTSLL